MAEPSEPDSLELRIAFHNAVSRFHDWIGGVAEPKVQFRGRFCPISVCFTSMSGSIMRGCIQRAAGFQVDWVVKRIESTSRRILGLAMLQLPSDNHLDSHFQLWISLLGALSIVGSPAFWDH
jgi:hypothetical protein